MGKFRQLLLCVMLLLNGAPMSSAMAAERATKPEAINFVKKAVSYFKAVGSVKAFAAFNDPNGHFKDRDLYIVAYDQAGTCLAHGAIATFIGLNRLDEQDADGVYFIKERVDMMKTQQSFWQDYKTTDPLTHKLMLKSTYCEKQQDENKKDFVVCAGVYDAQK